MTPLFIRPHSLDPIVHSGDSKSALLINNGTDRDCLIKELAHLVTGVIVSSGEVVFNNTWPDGTS